MLAIFLRNSVIQIAQSRRELMVNRTVKSACGEMNGSAQVIEKLEGSIEKLREENEQLHARLNTTASRDHLMTSAELGDSKAASRLSELMTSLRSRDFDDEDEEEESALLEEAVREMAPPGGEMVWSVVERKLKRRDEEVVRLEQLVRSSQADLDSLRDKKDE